MFTLTQRLRPAQNLGLNDRFIRGVIAILLIGLPCLDLARGNLFSWHGYVILLGIYPGLTSILGWDPFYSLFQVRSCGGSLRNQCGTFPYEVNAALGHNPIADIVNKNDEFDHSLTSTHQHDINPGKAMTKSQFLQLGLATTSLTLVVIGFLLWGPK